ncbi:MAG: superoxide dismutase family protein [Proteobacteria bacterium]|nr:superoxide dismutase family protein [Pseudomonadota bacterium]MBW3617743.1 superoxide dismutase family protein [Pseudomonadota bacterium]
MRPALFASLPVLLLAGCAGMMSETAGSATDAVTARADLVDGAGARVGVAEFSRAPRGGTLIRVRATGLTPGEHGIHIHQNPVCDAPGFTSAGPHLERPGRDDPHGLLQPRGGEAGDLPNLVAGADGTASAALVSASVAPTAGAAAPSVVGRAIVIHAQRDDQKTQPIGGSGDRVACGVIQARG